MTTQEAKDLGAKMAIDVIGSMDKKVDLIASFRSGFYAGISEFYEVQRNRINAEEDKRKAEALADFDKRIAI
jgi:hypothetical protein